LATTGKESVAEHVCPSCGETVTPVEGSLMPRPCPRCLDSTGRVVEMLPDEAKPPDSPAEES
jgi:rubrerythrin